KNNGYWWAAQAVFQHEMGFESEAEASMRQEEMRASFLRYSLTRKQALTEELASATGRKLMWHSLHVQLDRSSKIRRSPHGVRSPNLNQPTASADDLSIYSLAEAIPAGSFAMWIFASLLYLALQYSSRYLLTTLMSLIGLSIGLLVINVIAIGLNWQLLESFGLVVAIALSSYGMAISSFSPRIFGKLYAFILPTLSLVFWLLAIIQVSAAMWPTPVVQTLPNTVVCSTILIMLPMVRKVLRGEDHLPTARRAIQYLQITTASVTIVSTLSLLATESQRLQLAADLLARGS
ncbi:MAG: hypothetical protein KF812_12630, partial [Fimbriimonadaceae bacterium]|nr:hypothetical protein [Fimbriimonadaceae bacterium]